MALIAGALALGTAWVIYHPVEAARLPPAAERHYPAPGFEEKPTALGIVPPAPATDAPYAFTRTDGATIPVSWSPCRPIHYVVAGEGAPAGFHDQVITVIAEVSAATGLKFVDDGASVEAPNFERLPFQPTVYGDRWAPVLIEFADETTIERLSGPVLGVTKVTHTRDATTGVTHLVSGAVYLDTEILPRPNAHGHPAYVPVLRHELGHLVGLKHVDDVTQVMNATLTDVTAFQPGDLAGLAALGRGACAPGI
ncbi:hypothetical protein [Pengzhenrongella sp.]|jgi:hypothetical protein|uniref:hypothetical protein n=1 Tax=Pengzhenrongella sp. TaxID=2888820 RepID=UPI002F94AEA6